MTIPLNEGDSNSFSMMERETRLPVGFPGEHRKMSLMVESASVASSTCCK